jgi:hypothetical protein
MPKPISTPAAALLAELAEKVSRLEGWRPPQADKRLTSGFRGLDEILPDGGLRRGTLVEWLAGEPGSGAATLALIAAREASRAGGAVVVVDRRGTFYPPAAIRWGLELETLIVVRPRTVADEQWALDQVLRSQGVAALLAWPERLADREFRRLQLAAESGGTLGLLVRPAKARDEPSWADLRLLVEPAESLSQNHPRRGGQAHFAPRAPQNEPVPDGFGVSASAEAGTARRLRIEILRARGGAAGRTIHGILAEQSGTIHAEANPVHLAAPLADRTARRRSTGA